MARRGSERARAFAKGDGEIATSREPSLSGVIRESGDSGSRGRMKVAKSASNVLVNICFKGGAKGKDNGCKRNETAETVLWACT